MSSIYNSYKLALSFRDKLEKFSALDKKSSTVASDSFSIISEYHKLLSHFFSLKNKDHTSKEYDTIHQILLTSSYDLIQKKESKKDGLSYLEWKNSYQNIWLKNIDLFYFSLSVFILSMVVGYHIGTSEPDLVPVILPQALMEMIIDHTKWFEELQKNPLVGGLGIAINNIRVALLCFALGALFGIGAIMLLCYNGFLFGVIFGYCYNNGFLAQLVNFVLTHGFLELTIIIASAFAGLIIGKSFYLRPYKNFPTKFKEACSEAGVIISGVAPWLVLAAFFEGFVSPFHYLSTEIKCLLGVSICLGFIFWTFMPKKQPA